MKKDEISEDTSEDTSKTSDTSEKSPSAPRKAPRSSSASGAGLMGLVMPKTGYEGTVAIQGPQGPVQIQVTNGMAKVGPKTFFVRRNGVVSDEDQKVVGMVKSGQFTPLET